MAIDVNVPYIFSIELALQDDLDTGYNSDKLRTAFKNNGLSISKSSAITTQIRTDEWLITDCISKKEYLLKKKGEKINVYAKGHSNLHVVNQIVERDLCVRCGACEPACPVDIIRFNERQYPYLTDEELCIKNCTRCLKVCPGEFVNFAALDQELFGMHPHPDSITGIAKHALVSFATNARTRYEGTSGGFVTQILLYMLQKHLIDGALVLGTSTGQSDWKLGSFIARTAEDLKRAVGSKYVAVPFLRPLGEMEKVEGNYAVVALPCYIHALRKYQQVSKKLRERIKLIIGLYCNAVFEPYLVDEVCEFNDIPKDAVTDFQFRYGKWPGGMVARLSGGDARKVLKFEEWKDTFNSLKLLYTAPRCNMCIDFSAEYADLAVGDPWLRGPDGKYLFEDGRTTVLVRTEVGDQIVRMAADEHFIAVKAIPLKTYMMNFEQSARHKRSTIPKNLMLRRLFHLPVPEYNRVIGHGKASGYLPMLVRVAIHAMAKFKWFRRLSLSLAQTRAAIAYLAWNRARKAKKFAVRYLRFEKFVDTLHPIAITAIGNASKQDEHAKDT